MAPREPRAPYSRKRANDKTIKNASVAVGDLIRFSLPLLQQIHEEEEVEGQRFRLVRVDEVRVHDDGSKVLVLSVVKRITCDL